MSTCPDGDWVEVDEADRELWQRVIEILMMGPGEARDAAAQAVLEREAP